MNKNTKQACKLMTAIKKEKKIYRLLIDIIGRKGFSLPGYEQQDQVLHF